MLSALVQYLIISVTAIAQYIYSFIVNKQTCIKKKTLSKKTLSSTPGVRLPTPLLLTT